MKKILATLLLVASLLPAVAIAELYPLFGNVIDIEWDCDFVTADDGYGNLWDFYGVDFFEYGDLVLMYMDDNETPDWIYDDKVVDAYRCTADEASEFIQTYREKLREKMSPSFLDIFRAV